MCKSFSDLRDFIGRLNFTTALKFGILDYIDLGTFYGLRITHDSLFRILDYLLVPWDYRTVRDGKTA